MRRFLALALLVAAVCLVLGGLHSAMQTVSAVDATVGSIGCGHALPVAIRGVYDGGGGEPGDPVERKAEFDRLTAICQPKARAAAWPGTLMAALGGVGIASLVVIVVRRRRWAA